jgi:diguanylate cyclase (GGDEF)-like protein
MRLVTRQDRALVAGLAVAVVVMFLRPARYLLELANQVQNASGLALVPALIILTIVFIFQQQAKRQEARARAAAAEAETKQAEARAAEMERLIVFGQGLVRSLDTEAIRKVVLQQLPTLAETTDAWVLVTAGDHWEAFAGAPAEGCQDGASNREGVAGRVLAECGRTSAAGAVVDGEWVCLPMVAGGQVVGVLGVPASAGPLSENRRRTLAAAATLLGVSLRNAQLFREVSENAVRDGLTGCFNRTHSIEILEAELRRAHRSQSPLSLIMFDVDHFKAVNDRHGHLCGDTVLRTIGARMRNVLRGSDLKCRYGGEEFLILLPDTPLEGAKRVAETMRRELAAIEIPWKGESVSITASFGIAVSIPWEITPESIIGRADAALYEAKAQGRNRVCVSPEAVVA